MLLFLVSLTLLGAMARASASTSASFLQTSARLQPRLRVLPGLAKELWASGIGSGFVGHFPTRAESDPFLTWTPAANRIFAAWWRKSQFPENCEAYALQHGYVNVGNQRAYGITSAHRDIENHMLFAALSGKLAIMMSEADSKSSGIVCPHQAWPGLFGCFYEDPTKCSSVFIADHSAGKDWTKRPDSKFIWHAEVAEQPAWFLNRSQLLWEELEAAGAVQWNSASVAGAAGAAGAELLARGRLWRRFGARGRCTASGPAAAAPLIGAARGGPADERRRWGGYAPADHM